MRIVFGNPNSMITMEPDDRIEQLYVAVTEGGAVTIYGTITGEGEAENSNVHELSTTRRLQVAGTNDGTELSQEGGACSHVPEHDPFDPRCEDRYPKEGH